MEGINTVNMNGIDTTGQKGQGGVPADIEKQIKELQKGKLNVDEAGLLKVVETVGGLVVVEANTYTRIHPDVASAGTLVGMQSVKDGFIGEYFIEIETPSDRDYTYTFPLVVKWLNPITFERGMTYVISILNNVALWTSFETK